MSNVHVFTSAAFNYIPKVRMLFESIRKYHPDWILHLALADEIPEGADLSDEPFDDVLTIEDLGIPNWRAWSFCHAIVELATAIKPYALAKILDTPGVSKVFYFDPDMVVFSPLNDLLLALDNSSIVLTPHQTQPEESITAVMDNEICSLKHGVYNLGFIGVATNEVGKDFADWWSKRLYHFCRDDIPNGLFTDQKWINLVPALFSDVSIMRSSRHNVASWNLTTRNVTGDFSRGFNVNGDPLGFYHFTGFDSGDHLIMATKNSNGNQAVDELVHWYQNNVNELSKDPLSNTPWAFSRFSTGETITNVQRIVYRERIDLQRKFADPYDGSGFLQWWIHFGKKEYSRLSGPKINALELKNVFPYLSPGFNAGADYTGCVKVKDILALSVSNPEVRSKLFKRGWEIFKTEGFSGVMRRLR